MTSESNSTYLRKKGNKHYANALQDGSPSIMRDNLIIAMKYYYSAEREAGDPDEIASARKNIGIACWRVATLNVSLNEKLDICLQYYKQALDNISRSLMNCTVKSKEWKVNTRKKMEDCLEEAIEYISSLDYGAKIRALEDLSGVVYYRETKAAIYLRIATEMFHKSVSKLAAGDIKGSLALLGDCYRPVQEAKKFDTEIYDDQFDTDLRVLEGDLLLHSCISEASQALQTGDELLEHITLDQEDINIDMVWEVVDWYKKSILLTRELDLEREAIAHSKLGNVYDRVFKMKEYAKRNYKRGIELACTLAPRTFHDQQWYKDCAAALQKYQQEAARQDGKEYEERKKKYHAILKDELAILKKWKEKNDAGKKGNAELLKCIYKKFPLSDPKKTIDSGIDTQEYDKMRKAWIKAISHYHPDKVNADDDGEKLKFLHEEITKVITNVYNRDFKGGIE
ncbi:unnamed protein product [Owenia fusiformis]|uniref:Uncharacterized protein n=1 Tax=Owenia fusiformis TaxID=6347 RepID=A0A8J1Y1B9_OWEFU|nr:unnamed protein product [Owenia fusiformis]